jgi:tRNA threonylcarbamoyladenosine biosynthesis protein TsaE
VVDSAVLGNTVLDSLVLDTTVLDSSVLDSSVPETDSTSSDGRGGPGPAAVAESVLVPTAARMRELGVRLAGLLRAGDLVVLSGPLGAGKTTLTQGIGAGLGVRGQVTSPTFVIARLHPSLRGGPDLVHADAYRLGSRAEVDDLDLDADVDAAVTVVEWGEGLVENLAPSFLEIAIAPAPAVEAGETDETDGTDEAGEADEARNVRVVGWGDRWRDAAQATRQVLAAGPDEPDET